MMSHHSRPHGALLGVIATLLAVLAAIGLLLLASSRDVAAQPTTPSVRSSAILLLRGPDTLVVERVQRFPDRVSALIAMRGLPSTAIEYTLGADHRIPEATFVARGAGAAPDAPPLQTAVVRFAGDSALLEIRAGASVRSPRLATRAGALPIVNNDFVVLEQAVRMARAARVTTMTVPLFAMAGGQTIDATLTLVGADSARFAVGANVTEVALDAAGNVTGGRVPAAGITIAVVTGPAAAAVGFGRPDYSAPAGAPYTAEEVAVRTRAGHTLSGTLTLPPRAEGSRVPAVVTITGSGLQDRDEYIPFAGGVRLFREVADTLGRRGIAVLRLDDRGIGASGGDVNVSSVEFADDIRAAVEYLRTRPEVDATRIGLVGHSEGGLIAPMVASADPRLAAVVLMAGSAFNGRNIIDYQIGNAVAADTTIRAAARDSATRAAITQFDTTAAHTPWMRFFLGYDPLPTARRVRQPTLILQGATDHQVRPAEAELLDREMRAAGNRRVTLRIFPAVNHLFLNDPDGRTFRYGQLTDGRVSREVLGTLADWLVTTFGVR